MQGIRCRQDFPKVIGKGAVLGPVSDREIQEDS
jgi:hypothetical protein